MDGASNEAGERTGPSASKREADGIEVEPFEGLHGLKSQRGTWDELLANSHADRAFNHFDWVLAHAQAFVPEQLFGWTLRQGDRPVALFCLQKEKKRGVFALRRALLAGDGSFDTDYGEPLIHTDHMSKAVGYLLQLAHKQRGIDALVFSGLKNDAVFLSALRTELAQRRLPYNEGPTSSLVLELPSSFEEYLSGLKSRMRSKVRKAVRDAQQLETSFSLCTSSDQLDQELGTLFDLHAKRWQEVGQDGSFGDEKRRTFYRGMARSFLQRGGLRLTRLSHKERTVAVQLGLVEGATYYQLQEGYDPEYSSQRVGVALRALSKEALIEEGIRRYDYLAGDSQHKRDWGARPVPCTTLAFPTGGLRSRLSYRLRPLWNRLRSRS